MTKFKPIVITLLITNLISIGFAWNYKTNLDRQNEIYEYKVNLSKEFLLITSIKTVSGEFRDMASTGIFRNINDCKATAEGLNSGTAKINTGFGSKWHCEQSY